VWKRDVVLVSRQGKNLHFAPVLELPVDQNSLELTLCWDATAHHAVVYDEHGKQAASLNVKPPEKLSTAQEAAISLKNTGTNLVLEDLVIRPWAKDAAPRPTPKVSPRDASIDWTTAEELCWSGEPFPLTVPPTQPRALWWDGSSITGRLKSVTKEQMTLSPEWGEDRQITLSSQGLWRLLLGNTAVAKQPQEIESAAGTVLADNGTSFGHSVIVTVPREFRLRRGQVAMTGSGMVGRVVDAATDSGMARVLLLDDPASRLPVMISNSRARAILSGQGNGELLLEHLPGNAQVQMGDKIVTAGSDGVLPSDLALARITRIDGDRVYAEPLAALDRLEWLRIVDFGTISTLSKPNFQTP